MWESTTVRRSSRAMPALILCLGLAAAAGYASGQGESRLEEAKTLIAQKYYDQALTVLVELEKANPDLHDKARELVSQIMSIRTLYNKKYRDLIETLYVKADLEKSLALIKELDELDPHPNQAIIDAITEARKGAEYVYNLNQFKDLMNRAQALIAGKKYAEALALYVTPLKDPGTGFDLQRREFLSSGYGEIVQNSVISSVGKIAALAEEAAGAQPSVSKALADASSKPALLTDADMSALDGALAVLRAVMDMESGLEAAVDQVQAAGQAIQKVSKDGRKDFFTQYVTELCSGRPDTQEGIILVVDLMWRDAASPIAEKTAQDLASLFSSAEGSYSAGKLQEAQAAFLKVPLMSQAAVKTAALLGGGLKPSAGWKLTLQDGQELRELLSQAMTYQELAEESRAMVVLCQWRMDLAAMPAAASLDESALAAGRSGLSQRMDESRLRQKDWKGKTDRYAAQAKIIAAVGRLSSSAAVISERFAAYVTEAQKRDVGYAVRLAELGSRGFAPRLAAISTVRARAQDEMDGTTGGALPADAASVRKYPSKAMASLDEAGASLTALAADITSWTAARKAEVSYVSQDGAMLALIAAAQDVLKKIQAEQTLVGSLSKKAAEQHARALEFAKLGNQSYDKAVAAAKTDPESSSDLLDQATDAYGFSLNLEEDGAIRKRKEVDVESLRSQIAAALNVKIVTDVEKLISDGIKSVNSGDYLTANQKLTQADERWKEAHPGEMYSRDLEYWLELSRTAIKLTGGREILPTDANYRVVSSYLNLAYQSYLEAEKLVKKGDKAAAAAYLSDASHNVSAVLQLYPYNRNARILELKITRLTDESGFPGRLQALLKTYYADASSPNTTTKNNAYLGLKDIQEFLPNDKTLIAVISRLEIELGMRPPPISAADLKASDAAYLKAVAVYKKGAAETHAPALAYLDDALRLNPNNDKAKALRADINKNLPNPPPPSRRIADSYAKARDLLAANTPESISEAKRIVDELWKDPENRKWNPLVKLYNQIYRMIM